MHDILNFHMAYVIIDLRYGTLGHLCITISPILYATY